MSYEPDEREDYPPGHPTAIQFGCLCPQWENTNGLGWGVDEVGDIVYKVHKQCPRHKDDYIRKNRATRKPD